MQRRMTQINDGDAHGNQQHLQHTRARVESPMQARNQIGHGDVQKTRRGDRKDIRQHIGGSSSAT